MVFSLVNPLETCSSETLRRAPRRRAHVGIPRRVPYQADCLDRRLAEVAEVRVPL
jgi:hypothetical protein